MTNLLLLLIIELFLFFISFILSNRDILAPSVMVCVMFIISTTFALINFDNWDAVSYSLKACLIIASGITVFVIVENCFSHKKILLNLNRRAYYKEVTTVFTCDVEMWKIIIIIGFNLITIAWYYIEISRIVGAYGLNVENLFVAYRYINTRLAVASDSEVEMVNTLLSQFIKVTTGSGYVAGFILINRKIKKQRNKKKTIGLVIIILLSMAPSIMIAGRNPILQLIVGLMVYYYVLWHQENGWDRNLSWKYVRLGFILIIVGIPAFYLLLKIVGRTTEVGMIEYGSIYIGSSIALFNLFVASPVSAPSVFGEETLLGVHQLLYRLGVPTFVKNRHLEFRSLSDDISSNIYTFFRRPLHDYGLIGMYVFTALVALFFCWFYFYKIKNKTRTRRLDYWVISYGFIYYWVVYASIDQRSISFLSLSTVVTLFILIVLYYLMTKPIRFKIRR